MLKIQVLASGSKGNCIYVASDTTHILIDCGLSIRELKTRAISAKIDIEKIAAVLVTHEHSDHIYGLKPLLDIIPAKLYLHEKAVPMFTTYKNVQEFNKPFAIGDIDINFFNIPHDSQFCFGYTFTKQDAKIAVATDIGHMTDEIITNMTNSGIVLIECNHDHDMLDKNRKYPKYLKRRITGSSGHLSNPACAMAAYKLALSGTSQIILAHLSEENNTPSIAYEFVKNFLSSRGIIEGRDIWIDVATQRRPTVMYTVE